MKNFLIRELFWFVISSLVSFGLAFIYLELLEITSASYNLNEVEKLFYIQLYFIAWISSLVSVYIVRIVVSALKKYLGL